VIDRESREGYKQTAREPMKEIAYHVCISITMYVFACQGEIERNGGQKKSETGSNRDREGVLEGERERQKKEWREREGERDYESL